MTRKIDPEQKMSQVLAAARALFVAQGYHNVSIPAIVRASGVSIGAIYSYFDSKEGLARAIHAQTLAAFQQQLDERLADRQSAYQRLRAFAELVFEIAERDPETMEYMLFMKHGEFLRDVPPICSTRPFRQVQQIIAAGIEAGEIRAGDFLLAAVSFTGVILRAVELRLEGVLSIPLSEAAEELIANAWAAIRA